MKTVSGADWVFVTFILTWVLTDTVVALQCWHCIADNCDINPSENYKATKKVCQPNQCCQKVIFAMYSPTDNVKYTSTVRSCAGECYSHDDFENCTDDQYNTRGCVTKTCCDNQDFCNTANTYRTYSTWVTACVLTSVAFSIHAVMPLR
ncbi:uncharacterized protein LOC124115881 [Haliotis rufescens]|uniref:uncharacterized protein LOC124115881 n=1 Tax=Haliotis rufescens TaxID=6454 RepID=UPI001EB03F29|nr:uncharacterized protein LOC124115881 [Haliotis rufescens]